MWLKDPKNKKPSVSLTLMVISFIIAIAVAILMVFKQVEQSGIILELFYGTSSLYFFRKLTFRGKNIQIEQDKIDDGERQ